MVVGIGQLPKHMDGALLNYNKSMSVRQLDFKAATSSIVDGIRIYVGHKTVIIGISGGIDSALTATLCVRALGKDKVVGVLLPYGDQSDINDSLNLVNWLDIKSEVVNIKPIVDQYPSFSSKLVKANLMSRTRMAILYAFANSQDGLVVGTTNKSEMAIGYFTKYGDGGVDLEPIGELYKTEVWQMSKILNLPQQIISKAPTAGLWDGQTDENEMGFSYQQLDNYLQGETVSPDIKTKIDQLIASSEHKRHLAPVVQINHESTF